MQLEIGTILEGKVTGITNFGAFVELPDLKKGMVHISEVSNTFVKDISNHVRIGDTVKVKVININEKGEIALSIKKAVEQPQHAKRHFDSSLNRRNNANFAGLDRKGGKKAQEPTSFEDMMAMFKHASEEKMSDLKRSTESKRGKFSRRGTQHQQLNF